MKFGIAPLENKRLKFKSDIGYHHDLGMIHAHDIFDKQSKRWFRIYCNVLLMPAYARELFRLAEESYSFEEEKRYPFVIPKKLEELAITYVQDLKECYQLKLNNGTSVYYY
ncbi:hypothetical protein CN918_25335 [Priestia megaterium]|nr:hypothetical protein CN918_25335 [Priestia megaterium]